MNFQLKINGEVKKVSQITLEKISQVITTKFPTDGVASAVMFMGKGDGQAYLDSFASAGAPEDTIEIEHETSKGVYTWKGTATRATLAKKMELALNAESWQSVLPVTEKTDSPAKDKGEPEVI